MQIDSLEPIKEVVQQLPADWLKVDSLPPNTPSGLLYARAWLETPLDIKRRLISSANDHAALFVIWEWETNPELRIEIVPLLAAEAKAGVEKAKLVLRKIYFFETSDRGGKTVRDEVMQTLRELASDEERQEGEKGKVRPRSTIRTRGAVRTRGGPSFPAGPISARAILYELEDLEAANPSLP
jgi:hypothetical protein